MSVNSSLKTRQNYDRLSRWYDWFSSSEQRITEIGLGLLQIQPGENVLEIGFGTGHALIELANSSGAHGRVCGLDLSPGMLAVARRRIRRKGMTDRISLQIGDAKFLPYPDSLFQAAFMSFTLELFEADFIPIVLSECRRILTPEGRIVIVALAEKDSSVVKIYKWFHDRFPDTVDCRPIPVQSIIEKAEFAPTQIIEKGLWGLPAIAVAAKKV